MTPDLLPPALAERVGPDADPARADGDAVVYWMRVAARGHDNPALDAALELGRALDKPVFVYQGISERYPYASDRHHRFLLEGARDAAAELAQRGVAHVLHVERPGHRGRHLVDLAREAAVVTTDWMPLDPLRAWTRRLRNASGTPVWTVDASCVVPMPLSARRHHRAYAFRDAHADARARRLDAPSFEAEVHRSALPPLPFVPVDPATTDLEALIATCEIDHTVGPVPDTPGGSRAGYARWTRFRDEALGRYARRRNDAAADGVSRMSPYLHMGHVSPFRLAREAQAVGGKGAAKWLDELLIWRELAWHWAAHTERPDALDALPDHARATLQRHASDPRDRKSWETLARGTTGERLWDLCQHSLVRHGELHNNVRMTWGKALPHWTRDPAEALARLVDLNHRYALDGRDPSSFGGLLWCLGGFDRPFEPEQPVLGTVRGRSVAQHARRLDLDAYQARVHRPRRPFPRTTLVIGAGVAGLTCARTLHDHGEAVVVLDKGRGAGGRMSTRRWEGLRLNHGAPGFEVASPGLARLARSWVEDGRAAVWRPSTLVRDGDAWLPGPEPEAAATGAPATNDLLKHLGADLDVRYGTRVHGLTREADGWRADDADGTVIARADRVVVAIPAPQAVELLGDHPHAGALDGVAYQPALVALAVFTPRVSIEADRLLVDDVLAQAVRMPGDSRDPWVLHGSPAWSEVHLETPDEAARTLLQHFQRVTGAPDPIHLAGHRWRYARVRLPVGADCLWDPALGVGACGDALPGGGVDGAYRSGAAMAGRLLGTP